MLSAEPRAICEHSVEAPGAVRVAFPAHAARPLEGRLREARREAVSPPADPQRKCGAVVGPSALLKVKPLCRISREKQAAAGTASPEGFNIQKVLGR